MTDKSAMRKQKKKNTLGVTRTKLTNQGTPCGEDIKLRKKKDNPQWGGDRGGGGCFGARKPGRVPKDKLK